LGRAFPPNTTPAENNLTLWYGHPAWDWLQSLPVGNGHIGGMVGGGVDHEHIDLNEGTVWAGGPNDPVNPASTEAMKQIRALLLDGKSTEARDLWKKSAMAIPLHQPQYQTLG
jgi:alpha-L-fucosidase 2